MNRLDIFKKALSECQKLMHSYPSLPPLRSVENQLIYLIELEEGKRQDRHLLSTITLGLLAAREIEDRDMDLANLLYEVESLVDEMKSKN